MPQTKFWADAAQELPRHPKARQPFFANRGFDPQGRFTLARKRKPRRRMVYSYTFGFQDGSVIACGPERKPFERRIKEEGIHIDEDGVFREALYSPTSWHPWNDEQRREAVTILANRLNMRRAIRDLVLPELKELKTVLLDIEKRLGQIEQAIAKADRRDATA